MHGICPKSPLAISVACCKYALKKFRQAQVNASIRFLIYNWVVHSQREANAEREGEGKKKRVNVGQGDMRPEQTMHALFSHGQSICGRLQYAVAHVRKEKGKNKPQKLLHVLCTVRVTGSRSGTTRRGVEREAARPRNLVSPNFQPGVKSPIRWIPSSN